MVYITEASFHTFHKGDVTAFPFKHSCKIILQPTDLGNFNVYNHYMSIPK